ncbi:anion permease [Methylobacterium sp. NEAU 140]|uniref:anion permease n=1 Tax=Methylobacterium sp. NEAU 140 TaxID=3064945 RepID=UPI002732DC01|nr:anion permease [Methylobacterium sp. NEAU 140]MDP4026868.1 anion permease [Methylobacterium sp. NEAU 140]
MTSSPTVAAPHPTPEIRQPTEPRRKIPWQALLPVAVALLIAIVPAPGGLAPHAWYFFAIFTGVIVGLMVEPIPGPAISLIGVTVATVLAPWVLYSPAELAKPGFNAVNAALTWGLSGFGNATVWLIFGAFMFALGYEKTGLGRRIALILVRAMGRRTLTLGYAVTLADTLLAPFTPSTTARSAGTIFPIVRNLPPLYDSRPNDPSARKIGSYLMWTALAATCINSSMFLTGMAPNLLAVEIVKKTAKLDISWMDWFSAFAPVGVLLLLALPLLVYVLYPPVIKAGTEVPAWAERELATMGGLSRREIVLAVLVLLALALWIFGGDYVNATTAALLVVSLMLLTRIVTWDDILGNKQAWSTLVWFATLIALADGLNRTGFVTWFAQSVAAHMGGFSPITAMIVLVCVYFGSHYLFASITAHTTAMLPVMLAVGAAVPGMPMLVLSQMLVLSGGIMSVLTPYAGGPNPVYYGSGYLPAKDFWRLGAIFGAVFFGLWLVLGTPLVLARFS